MSYFNFFSLLAKLLLSVICMIIIFKSDKFILSTIPFRKKNLWLLKKILLLSGIIFLLISFCDLYSGDIEGGKRPKNESDIFFVLDFTSSMRVEDTKHGSRLESAIGNILQVAEKLNGNRFGLLIFSDKEYQLVPLTSDKEFFRQHLISLRENVKPDGGGNVLVALKEIELREKGNQNLIVVVVSDFENIGLSSRQGSKISDIFPVIGFGVGSTSGGRIPNFIQDKFGKKKYLSKEGREVFSYLDNKTLDLFEFKTHDSNSLISEIKIIQNNNIHDTGAWVSVAQKSYGNVFVFLGLILFFLSSLMLYLKKYFALSVVIFFVSLNVSANSNSNDIYISNVLSGNADANDFLDLASSLIVEKKYEVAEKLYLEQQNNLDLYGKLNLGSLYFLNKNFKNGVSEYIKFLEVTAKSGIDNLSARNNLMIFFKKKGRSGSASKNSKGSENDPKGKGQGQGSPSKNKINKSDSSGLSNEAILKKLKSDDMVNQGEYIQKKIKTNPRSNEIKW